MYSLFKTSFRGPPEENYFSKMLGKAIKRAYLALWVYSEKKILTSSWRRKVPVVLFSQQYGPLSVHVLKIPFVSIV